MELNEEAKVWSVKCERAKIGGKDKGKRFEFDKVSRFVYDIERVYRFLSVSRDDYPLSEKRVREIQSSVLAGSYGFSPVKIVSMTKDDPIKNNFSTLVEVPGLPNHLFSIYFEPEDELVLMALGGYLNLRLNEESVFHANSFAYREDRSAQDFHKQVLSWNRVLACGGKVESVLVFDFSSFYTPFPGLLF